MSHVLKVFLRVIHRRVHRKLEENIGFWNALNKVQVLVQRCREINQELHLRIIDIKKAFDRVKEDKMIEILGEGDNDDNNLRLIFNFYWRQKAVIREANARRDRHSESGQAGVYCRHCFSTYILRKYSKRVWAK